MNFDGVRLVLNRVLETKRSEHCFTTYEDMRCEGDTDVLVILPGFGPFIPPFPY